MTESSTPTPPLSVLTVCSTCTDTSKSGEEGLGGGARLVALVEQALARRAPDCGVSLHHNRCLMACTQGCTVALSAPGKMQYLLGRWPAEADSAEAIVEFACQHAASLSGIVANDTWPTAITMRFLGRIPPLEPAQGVDWRDDGCNL